MPSPVWRASTARRSPPMVTVKRPAAPATSTGTVSPPACASNFTGSSSPAAAPAARRPASPRARRATPPRRRSPRALVGGQRRRDQRDRAVPARRLRLVGRQQALHEAGREAARHEVRVRDDALEDRDRGLHAGHRVLAERAPHARDRRVAVGPPHDQLGHQRVVEARDRAARVDAGVVAHPGAARRPQPDDRPRRRDEARERILRVDAALDRPAAQRDVVLREAELLARRDAELLLHEIEPGHQLGHRVLDLQARVHLEEVEVALAVHQELDRARVDVADRGGHPAGRLAHAAPHLRRDERRRALLDQLLVAALDRALALAEVHDVAVRVGQHLDLDVARLLDVALDVDGGVAERGARLRARGAQRARQLAGRRARGACPCRRRPSRPSASPDSPRSLGHPRGLRVVRDRLARCRARPARPS